MADKRKVFTKKDDPRNSEPKPQKHKDRIGASVQAYHDSLSEQDKKTKLRVKGQKVTYKQWKIFEVYNTVGNGSPKQTADLTGVSVANVRRLREKDWWGELTAEFIDSRQDWMFRELADKIPKLTQAVISIWDGTIAEPKLAAAIVKSMETFNKMGKRHGKAFTEPLTKSKQDLYLTDNSTHNTQVNINMTDHFNDMTLDELQTYGESGAIPVRFEQITDGEEE